MFFELETRLSQEKYFHFSAYAKKYDLFLNLNVAKIS